MEEIQNQTTESVPLHVLFVAARSFPYMGGVETHVYEVGRRLARAGIKITVLSTDVSGKLPRIEELEGMQIRRVRAWPGNKDYYFAPDIFRLIMSGRWDIIHCQGYHTLVPPLAMSAAIRANIPFVLSFHSGGDVSFFYKALRGLQWKVLRPLMLRAERLVAVSEFEAKFFQKRLRLPAERFTVIPNGAHLSEQVELTERTLFDANDDPLIVSIGRLERYKGHQRVIAAMPEVLEQIPNARLRIVGTGPFESTLRQIARQLDIAGQVEIQAIPPGDRNGMARLLARANLVTLLSEYESQGIAVMEALALQRPVLVADTSALQELAGHSLVRVVPLESSPEEVAKAITSQLRQNGKPVNVALPTWDVCASKLLHLYQTTTGRVSCVS